MVNCKKCGAAIPPGATVCEYCGSLAVLPQESPAVGTKTALGAVPRTAPMSAPRFKRISATMIVILTVISFGLYVSAWFFVRRWKFAELSPKAKNAGFLFGGLLAIHIIYLFGLFNYLIDIELLWLALVGTLIYSSMVARAALAEFAAHSGAPRSLNFAGSIFWTIIFSALYLQSQINRMLDASLLNEA